MKGQTSTPFMIIIGFLGFLMIISIVSGIQQRTGDHVKEQSVEIQSKRVANAVLALESTNRGYIEIEMEGYKISFRDYNVTVGYEDSNSSFIIDQDMVNYDRVERTRFQEIESSICIRRKLENDDKVLLIEPEAC